MRFFLGWASLGVAAVILNGCFQVGDDDASGGEGGQSGDDGKTGGTSMGGAAGSVAGTGAGRGGSSSAGTAGKPQAGRDSGSFIGRGGTAGKGGSSGTGGSNATGGTDLQAGSDGSGGSSGGTKGGGGGTGGSATGGSGGTSGGPPLPEGTCDDWAKKLKTCGVASGTLDCASPTGGDYYPCWYGCFAEASCDQVVDGLCTSDASNALVDCVNACSDLTFECGPGDTVPASYECDGYEDCSNGKDEANCPAHVGNFACGDGTYVSSSSYCDDFDDCSNGHDELDCPMLTCPLPPAQTPGAVCSKAAAQLKSCGLLPGGVMTSCTDFTEQQACKKNCFVNASCSALENYFCSDSTAGDPIVQCADDCASASDEFPCKADGYAISSSWVCDDAPDCSDGSDEVGCSLTCGDGTIVTWLHMCDGYNDCSDGKDEAGCMATCPAAN